MIEYASLEVWDPTSNSSQWTGWIQVICITILILLTLLIFSISFFLGREYAKKERVRYNILSSIGKEG